MPRVDGLPAHATATVIGNGSTDVLMKSDVDAENQRTLKRARLEFCELDDSCTFPPGLGGGGGGGDVTLNGIQTLTNKTLVEPFISNGSFKTQIGCNAAATDHYVALPNASGNFVLDSHVQTLTQKTLVQPNISNGTFSHQLISAAAVSNKSATLPNETGTLVVENNELGVPSLYEKTLYSPRIVNPFNYGHFLTSENTIPTDQAFFLPNTSGRAVVEDANLNNGRIVGNKQISIAGGSLNAPPLNVGHDTTQGWFFEAAQAVSNFGTRNVMSLVSATTRIVQYITEGILIPYTKRIWFTRDDGSNLMSIYPTQSTARYLILDNQGGNAGVDVLVASTNTGDSVTPRGGLRVRASATGHQSPFAITDITGATPILMFDSANKQLLGPDVSGVNPQYSYLSERNSGWLRLASGQHFFQVLGNTALSYNQGVAFQANGGSTTSSFRLNTSGEYRMGLGTESSAKFITRQTSGEIVAGNAATTVTGAVANWWIFPCGSTRYTFHLQISNITVSNNQQGIIDVTFPLSHAHAFGQGMITNGNGQRVCYLDYTLPNIATPLVRRILFPTNAGTLTGNIILTGFWDQTTGFQT